VEEAVFILASGHGNKATQGCPCGFLGDAVRECRCTPQQIGRYRDRLSGPLRDRLDLTVEVPALPPDAFGAAGSGEPSAAVRDRVIAARARQRERYLHEPVRTNTELTPPLLRRYCGVDGAGRSLLNAAISRMGLSARGYDRVRKVARTIADLGDADQIGADHLAEALQYRMMA
jgi:magnesium chelatase family protein